MSVSSPERPNPWLGAARLDDPELVRREYADEHRLARRSALYREFLRGDDPLEVAFTTVCALRPRRVLQVGCGRGAFAHRVAVELGASVIAIDLSPRMVALARELGVDALHGDVQELPFADGAFDCVVANWMLHHVPRLGRAVAEVSRVLAPGGSLVATTMGAGDLEELWSLLGSASRSEASFTAESGAAVLAPRFGRVERRDVYGTLEFPGAGMARRFVAASLSSNHLVPLVPDFAGPVEVSTHNCVFTAVRAGG